VEGNYARADVRLFIEEELQEHDLVKYWAFV
jgi:hypothetical protein